MSAPTLEQTVYEMATRALDHQERRVADLRTRTSALLAAASLTASFLGAIAIREGGGLGVLAVGALLALVLTTAFALAVLWPAELLFAINPEDMYAELYEDRDDPATYLRRVANALNAAHTANRSKLDDRDLWFRASAVLLGLQTVLWVADLAVS